jgi:hypothetical protein
MNRAKASSSAPQLTWLPVICIDARHAKAVLKMKINKSGRNDAAGIARRS